MRSLTENGLTQLAGLLGACAQELAVLQHRVAAMEAVVVPEIMRSPAILENEKLHAAIQDFDWIAQHLQALHALLVDASDNVGGWDEQRIARAMARIGLSEVACRLAAGMAESKARDIESDLQAIARLSGAA